MNDMVMNAAEATKAWTTVQFLVAFLVMQTIALVYFVRAYMKARDEKDEVIRETYVTLTKVSESFPALQQKIDEFLVVGRDIEKVVMKCRGPSQ